MNIFALSPLPSIAAQFHCDNHVNKMLIESAQMLSTAWHVVAPDELKINQAGDWTIAHSGMKIYKPFTPNHPCNKWVRECRENYFWLMLLAKHLAKEYTKRFGKVHATQRIVEALEQPPNALPSIVCGTSHVQCMPLIYRKLNNPIDAYREYYRIEKVTFAKWTNTEVPYWFDTILARKA